MKFSIKKISLLIIFLVGYGCDEPIEKPTISSPDIHPWYNIRYDYSNTGYYPGELSIIGNIRDTLEFGLPYDLTTPVFDDSGNCYVSTLEGLVSKFDKELNLVWQADFDTEISGSGCVLDSVIIFGSKDDIILGVTPNGKLSWTIETFGDVINPPIAHYDLGFAIAYSLLGLFYIFDAEGTVLFHTNTSSECNDLFPDLPTMDSEGNIYVSNCNEIYSFSYTGIMNWHRTYVEFDQIKYPLVYSNGVIYATSSENYLMAIDAEYGNFLWETKNPNGSGNLGFSVDPSGTVYWSNIFTGIEVFDRYGNYINTISASNDREYRPDIYPLLDGSNNVYYGTTTGNYIISATTNGTINWEISLDYNSLYGITVNNGLLYFCVRQNDIIVVVE